MSSRKATHNARLQNERCVFRTGACLRLNNYAACAMSSHVSTADSQHVTELRTRSISAVGKHAFDQSAYERLSNEDDRLFDLNVLCSFVWLHCTISKAEKNYVRIRSLKNYVRFRSLKIYVRYRSVNPSPRAPFCFPRQTKIEATAFRLNRPGVNIRFTAPPLTTQVML